MHKRIISFLVSIVFSITFLISVPVNASLVDDISICSDSRFSCSDDILSTAYDYDYWIIVATPYSYSQPNHFTFTLFLISDDSFETYGTEEGVLIVYTDTYPYNSYIPSVYTGVGKSVDYSRSIYYAPRFSYSSPGNISFNSSSSVKRNLSASYTGFAFDNYNSDKFPVYSGPASNYTSSYILASNVDIYNQYGVLVQEGNYHTLLNYFNGTLDASKIIDFSGSEAAPGVTDPTYEDSKIGKEQLETSKGIFGTVKNIFDSLSELPSKIANAISGFFTTLKDGIIDGLKFLFIPSENLFDNLKDKFFSKFGFISQLSSLVYDLRSITYDDKPPENKITLYGVTVNFVNWEFYDDYRELINNIIIIISYYIFFWNIRRRLPDIIGGSYKL